MFDREIKLIGTELFKKIQSKTVMVIGVGGVGGYAVEGLVRGGISNIIVVDYDKVDITNLNRQIISLQDNVGQLKTDVIKNRIMAINPNCNVTIVNQKVELDNIETLFEQKIDYIVDACDTIKVKERLITLAVTKKIKLISCMGTGNKLKPELLAITEIRKTSYDPIAKRIRKFVVNNNIKEKVMVVSSTEQPKKVANAVGTISYVPAIAGMLCASYVINDIIKER